MPSTVDPILIFFGALFGLWVVLTEPGRKVGAVVCVGAALYWGWGVFSREHLCAGGRPCPIQPSWAGVCWAKNGALMSAPDGMQYLVPTPGAVAQARCLDIRGPLAPQSSDGLPAPSTQPAVIF